MQYDEKEGFEAAIELFGPVLGIADLHPAEMECSQYELDEHRNVLMTLIHKALPSVRGIRPRRVTKEHFISERVLFHLVEKYLDAESNKIRRFGKVRAKVFTFHGGLEQFNNIVAKSNNYKWAQKRFGRNARTYIMDKQKFLGGVGDGGDLKIIFSMDSLSLGGDVRNREVIEQGRMRISFVYTADGLEEALDDPEAQNDHEEQIAREIAVDDAVLAEFLD